MDITRLIKSFALLALIALPWQSSLAQSSADVESIEVAQVDNSAYPEVTLYVRILDAEGKRVPNLTQDLFAVQEDGQPVEIVNFSSVNEGTIQTLMLIDTSGSMNEGGKMEGAKEAALSFLDLTRSQDQVGLLVFNHTIYDQVDFTIDADRLRSRIQGLFADGGTAWYDAVVAASNQVAGLSGRKSLLLLTDGIDEDSRSSFNRAVDAAQNSGASVYTIGLGQSGEYDEGRLERIAQETNGDFYHAPSPAELEVLYRSIAQSTQDEYVLTYRSPRPDYDGTRRNIGVKVGEAGGSGGYVETHLVTVRSEGWVGLMCLLPLAALLFVPPLGRELLRRRRARALAAQAAKQARSPGVQPVVAPAPPSAQADGAWSPQSLQIVPQPVSEALAPANTCRHCGRVLKAGVRFCPGCGQPVSAPPVAAPPAARAGGPQPVPAQAAARACPHCGRQLRPGARFCNACGKQL